jgi:ribonuclease R
MNLQTEILRLLGASDYQPLDKVGLSKKLGLPAGDRHKIREALASMERAGSIARIRKNFYVLPDSAGLVIGTVLGFPGGNAKLIETENDRGEVFVSALNLSTAMHGDRVVARLIHEGREHSREMHPQRLEARVIKILSIANETLVGTVASTKGFQYVIPDDPRIPQDIYLRKTKTELPSPPHDGDKVVVRLDPWESRHVSPEGVVLEVLGKSSDPAVDLLSILRKYSLPQNFPPEVLAEASVIPETLTPADWHGREDCRDQPVVTIDPDDAKDYDDAIHVERHSGGWRLAVHIADVSHYVRRGTALDKEAQRRGNSTYLAGRVIPMLPERLSNGVCSLKAGVDRLAFSAFIDFTFQGKVKKVRFARTVIRSMARLTYKQAFAILEDRLQNRSDLPSVPDGSRCYTDPVVCERVRAAWELATLLRTKRFSSGSLDLDFPEVKVWLDDKGYPLSLEKIINDPSHQLIEECMLTANEAVALALKKNSKPAVYRIHESPDADRLNEFREKVLQYGYRIGDLGKREEVQKLLNKLRGEPDEAHLKVEFLKSLKRATYSISPIGHYGLAKNNYTHFTSPIRRYADLLVHRGLANENVPAAGELASVALHISNTERVSAEAEKDSIQRKKLQYFVRQLRSRNLEVFAAIVRDVRSYGLVIELPDILFTGLIHVSQLPGDFYAFDSMQLAFRGKRHKKRFQIGTALRVRVCKVDLHKRQVDFEPAPDPDIARKPNSKTASSGIDPSSKTIRRASERIKKQLRNSKNKGRRKYQKPR